MNPAELKAWLRLTLSPGIGNGAARKLLAAFGSAQAVFEQSPARWAALGSSKLVKALQTEPPTLAGLLATTQAWLAGDHAAGAEGAEAAGVSGPTESDAPATGQRRIVTLGDAAYPPSLLNIEDPPLMLYMLGVAVDWTPGDAESIANGTHCLAMVGSRNPTPQGAVNARQFAQSFAQSGLTVVSGLALGVDGAAHDGALLGGGLTIAVVGTGLDRVYPKKHLALAHRIAAQGLIISEFPLGTPPLTANFPKRNRIIAGLCQGTLVVEAALKSGSLITARLAAEQGKDVFAIPGSIHSPQSRGCHALIKQGAKLVENAQDVLEELKWPYLPANGQSALSLSAEGDALDDSEGDEAAPDTALLTAMGFDVVSLDALQARTGWPTPELQARLLELELMGQVSRLPGGLFQRISSA